jgi:pimeloyl-ACP methyl ester carboxylesterase
MRVRPVVLLHSGGMSSRQWRKLAALLARTTPPHVVLAPDFLGSGEEPPWPLDQPFHFSADADRIEALVRAQATPVHLVGHSYGGFLALTVARRCPELVASLAVYDPVAFGVLHGANDAEGLRDLARAEENPVFTDIANGGDDAWFEAFVDYWNGAGTWRNMVQAARDSFLRVGRKVFFEVHTLMQDRTPAEAYQVVKSPALFLTGSLSPAAAQRVVALAAAACPAGRTLTVAGAGHMGPISHADAVNEAIVEHLERAEAALS